KSHERDVVLGQRVRKVMNPVRERDYVEHLRGFKERTPLLLHLPLQLLSLAAGQLLAVRNLGLQVRIEWQNDSAHTCPSCVLVHVTPPMYRYTRAKSRG